MVDRTRAPMPRADAPLHFPAFRRERLASGLAAYVLEDHRTPMVAMRVLFPWGGASDPPERPGLAAFTASLLEDGTTRRSSQRIAQEIESLGGSLGSGAGWSSAVVSARVLSRDLGAGLELLADVATDPAFAEVEVERRRRERLAEWLRRRDQPGALAEESFAEAVYGSTPYGHSLLGDERSLRATARDEIVRFWSGRRSAVGASLLVVGDVDADRVLRAAERSLSGLGGAAPPAEPALDPPPPRRRVIVVDRPEAAQTELRIGHVGPPRRHPDHAGLTLANALLGGKFTSRINLNLRERHGFTYGAHSAFVERRGPGPFLVWTAVKNETAGRAAREILGEVARLRDEPVPLDELAEGIRYLRGVFPYGLQTIGGILGRLEELAVFDLPDDEFDRTLEALGAMRPEDVARVARIHLRPDDAVVIAVGPAATLAAELADLGEVEIARQVPAAA
jgi:zinc protease